MAVGNVATDAAHVGGVLMVCPIILHFSEWEVRSIMLSGFLKQLQAGNLCLNNLVYNSIKCRLWVFQNMFIALGIVQCWWILTTQLKICLEIFALRQHYLVSLLEKWWCNFFFWEIDTSLHDKFAPVVWL